MTKLSINIEDKRFQNGTVAINNLSFQSNEGEFIAIVGPSGAGKTTLLNIIAGLDSEYTGELLLNGDLLDSKEPSSTLGFMFQESRLMPWLTVKQNIELVLKNDYSHGRLSSLLEQTDLSDFADNFPSQLSGGMKKRASMVRAFINQPQLLLMDEPFQSLDAPTANHLREILIQLWQQMQSVVVFVTHDLREALSMADRVLFLSARPSTIIMDYTVDLPRPRTLESVAISQLQQSLLAQYPNLLSGSLNAEPKNEPQ